MIFKLVKNILLIILAFVVIVLVVFPALFWLIKVSVYKNKNNAREMISGVSEFFLAIAGAMDKFGNCAYGGYFNSVLLVNVVHPFGNSSETISTVLGWGYKYDDLTPLGIWLRNFVNKVDNSTTDHCEYYRLVSVRNSQKIVYEQLKLVA